MEAIKTKKLNSHIKQADIRTKQTNIGNNSNIRSTNHYHRPVVNSLTKSELKDTTILIGGLTPTHNYLVEGALKNLGIKVQALPNEDKNSSNLGREYGINGYCNPAYFTTGNLIKFLQKLHAEGMDKKEIVNKYVLLTAGCGDSPCRFGMYESLYLLSLENAGFTGFRILTFDQAGGMSQEKKEVAIKFNFEFFLTLVNAFIIGDLLNNLVLSIRPYEVNKGETDKVLNESLKYLYSKLNDFARIDENSRWKKALEKINLGQSVHFIHLLYRMMTNKYYIKALNKVQKRFAKIYIDRLKLVPKVKITGEFWASLAQGDGNFNLYSFLEGEGAEVKSEYVCTYLAYLLDKHLLRHVDGRKTTIPKWHLLTRIRYNIKFYKKYLSIYFGERLLKKLFNRYIKALGNTLHPLPDFNQYQKITANYYNKMLSGGEGYMEVAKNIYYHENHLAHMVLSVKPFGCMPSTISDGVQVKVIEKYDDMIFLPIETSLDGEINAHSRVQMSLFDAKAKAKLEFEEAIVKCGKKIDKLKRYVEDNPYLKNPFYKIPHCNKMVGAAPNFIIHLQGLMKKEKI